MKMVAMLVVVGSLAACGAQPAAEPAAERTRAETASGGDARPGRARRARSGFLRADADRDGVVTRAELGDEADGRFAKIDKDGDGTASTSELSDRAARAERRGNEDSASRPVAAITRADYRDRALARFDRRDADRDGRLADDELSPQR